jgi:hypothetical protein
MQSGNKNGRGAWRPLCIAICAPSGYERLAVAGEGASGLVEVHLFQLKPNGKARIMNPLCTYRNDAVDTATKVNFCPTGDAVAVVTAGNRALVWHMRQTPVPRPAISIKAHGLASIIWLGSLKNAN